MYPLSDLACQSVEAVGNWAPIGLATSVGLLGGYAVYKLLQSGHPSSKADKMQVVSGKVSHGQGEYLVFKNDNGKLSGRLSTKEFDEAYRAIYSMAPEILAATPDKNAEESYANRYTILKERVKEVDPDLDIVFIPRTLVELLYMRKCSEELANLNSACGMFLNSDDFRAKITEQYRSQQDQETPNTKFCWHGMLFNNLSKDRKSVLPESEVLSEEYLTIAYRFNREVVEEFALDLDLNEQITGFTHSQFQERVEAEITSLQKQSKKLFSDKIKDSCPLNILLDPHGEDKFNLSRRKQAVLGALRLDCSLAAQRSVIIYRGSKYRLDKPVSYQTPYSLSFGTSLFAGAAFDTTATVFTYINKFNDCYAIPLAISDIKNSSFYIPPTNTFIQLHGKGEVFHARTIGWKDCDPNDIGGLRGIYSVKTHLLSSLSKSQVQSEFARHKANAILLHD